MKQLMLVIIPLLVLAIPTLAFAHHMDFTTSKDCQPTNAIDGGAYWYNDVCQRGGIPPSHQQAIMSANLTCHHGTCEAGVGRIGG